MTDGSPPYGPRRFREVFADGMLAGETPAVPVDFDDLERAAAEAMDEERYDYVAGGAGAEETLVENRRAFDRWRIVPRVFRDVSTRDLSVELFGDDLPAPVVCSPVGVQTLAHEAAERAAARAAGDLGVPFCLSTQSSTPMEDVAAATDDAPRWFQLYWSRDRDLTESLVSRAEAAGYSALVVTLDIPVLGWRTRDLDQGFLPFMDAEGIANYTSDPVFLEALDAPPEEDPSEAVEQFLDVFSDATLTWSDLDWLRERTDLPIVLKGVLHPDDARRAVAHGADGVWVSNHGGRQVDGAVGALQALSDVVEAVDDRLPVLFDSGVRSGGDAVRALALGADAVGLGRPYVYGLAVAGEEGVREVLANVLGDLDVTLAQTGETAVTDLDRSNLARADR